MINKKIICEENNIRIDTYIAGIEKSFSRSLVSKLISEGNILVNNKNIKSSYKINNGDIISINYIPPSTEIIPIKMNLHIIYEDEYYAFINKPKGLITHPASSVKEITLVSGLLYKYGDYLSDISGSERRGIVHRLDKNTSGILCICKTNEAHLKYAKLIEKREVKKTYYALVKGKVNTPGTIDKPIGRDSKNRTKMCVTKNGKYAITHYKPIQIIGNMTLLEIIIETGRTHQIRVHMKHIGHPIIGDDVYGTPSNICVGQALHAYSLEFIHPFFKENIKLVADLPEYISKYIC